MKNKTKKKTPVIIIFRTFKLQKPVFIYQPLDLNFKFRRQLSSKAFISVTLNRLPAIKLFSRFYALHPHYEPVSNTISPSCVFGKDEAVRSRMPYFVLYGTQSSFFVPESLMSLCLY